MTAFLRDAIKANAAPGGAFVIDRSRGLVPLSEFTKYDVVIWATGEQYENTLDASDQAVLQQYLEGGGRLIVTGQDVGDDIGSSSFYRDTLKTRFVADSSDTDKFVTSGVLGNVAYNLNAAGSAQNQFYPDVISNIGSSVVAASWGTAQAEAGAIVLNDAGTYRTVNMGFGLEGLTSTSRSNLLKMTLNWLMR